MVDVWDSVSEDVLVDNWVVTGFGVSVAGGGVGEKDRVCNGELEDKLVGKLVEIDEVGTFVVDDMFLSVCELTSFVIMNDIKHMCSKNTVWI